MYTDQKPQLTSIDHGHIFVAKRAHQLGDFVYVHELTVPLANWLCSQLCSSIGFGLGGLTSFHHETNAFLVRRIGRKPGRDVGLHA